jgi:antirestriction protein ArdC
MGKLSEKRTKMRELASEINSMTAEQQTEFMERCGGIVNIEGRPLSFHNTMLLLHQREQVSVVGGYKQWKAAGRQVRKGKHGMTLWFPSKQKDAETGEEAGTSFFMGTVFDISQTDPVEVEVAIEA